jgi:hypothetical protein
LAEGQAGRAQACPNNDRPPCMADASDFLLAADMP